MSTAFKRCVLLAITIASMTLPPGLSDAMGSKPDVAASKESPAAIPNTAAEKAVAANTQDTAATSKAASETQQSASITSIKDLFNADGSNVPLEPGTLGDKLSAVANEPFGTPPSALMESLKDISGGSMAPSSSDAFPPFFGDGGAQQPSGPQGAPGSSQSIVGTWAAAHGQYVLAMIFQPNGACALIDKGQKVTGSYQIQGNQLIMRFANGKTCTLNFSIQGNFLVFSDGSRLLRQPGGAQPLSSPVSQQQPVPMSPGGISNQSLEGAWIVSDGKTTVIMMFQNGICGMNVNGRQFYGPYTVQGNQLNVQFQNAQALNVGFAVEGDRLRLSDGTVLMRQPLPNTPVGSPGTPAAPQQQNPGGWGQPPVQQPLPSANATPLEGVWGTQLPNGMTIEFVFQGNQYRVLTNGQQTETGMFTLDGNRLAYTTTSGQAAGQKGINSWQINGNMLFLTMQNGTSVQLQRRP